MGRGNPGTKGAARSAWESFGAPTEAEMRVQAPAAGRWSSPP